MWPGGGGGHRARQQVWVAMCDGQTLFLGDGGPAACHFPGRWQTPSLGWDARGQHHALLSSIGPGLEWLGARPQGVHSLCQPLPARTPS